MLDLRVLNRIGNNNSISMPIGLVTLFTFFLSFIV